MNRGIAASLVGLGWIAFGLPLPVRADAPAPVPAALREDVDEIQEKFALIRGLIGKADQRDIRQSLDEASDWIDELAETGKLSADDPLLVQLRSQLDELANASTPAPTKPTGPSRQEKKAKDAALLESLLKIDVDLAQVSFKRDVAPIIADHCLNCHNANRKAGDFNASTFALFAEQIVPGKPDDSHLLNLVTGKEQPRMPRGNAGFPREAVDIWTAWIKQGAKFDGPNPREPITSYLVDADAKRRERIAKLSPADLESLRRLAAEQKMDLVAPQKPVSRYESPHALVLTTRPQADAEYIAVLAEAILEELAPRFPSSTELWPGRLAIFVFADRYDYVAFARQVDNYDPEDAEFGHFRSRPELAYVALTADVAGSTLDQTVPQQVLAAFYATIGKGKMPQWAIYGSARAESTSWDPDGAPSVRNELAAASRWMAQEKWSSSLFDDKLPWVDAAPLATSFFTYLHQQDRKRMAQLQQALADGTETSVALQRTLGVTGENLTGPWYAWIRRKYK